MTDSLASRAAKGTATLTELVDRTDLGDPPANFSPIARQKWEEVRAELVRLGTADSSLRSAVIRLCQDHEIIERAHADIMERGFEIQVPGPRNRPISKPNPAAVVLSAAGTRYQATLNSLGLTVASQSKIRPKSAETKEDPFAEFDAE